MPDVEIRFVKSYGRMLCSLTYRAERNEVPPQPTLSTTSKRQQQQQQQQQGQGQLKTTGKNAGAGAAGADQQAHQALKWVCAYSFKYR